MVGCKAMTRLEHSILESHFPMNTMIIVDQTNHRNVLRNSLGRVVSINKEMGTILVDFEDGNRYGLIYGVDLFHKYMKPKYSRGGHDDSGY